MLVKGATKDSCCQGLSKNAVKNNAVHFPYPYFIRQYGIGVYIDNFLTAKA